MNHFTPISSKFLKRAVWISFSFHIALFIIFSWKMPSSKKMAPPKAIKENVRVIKKSVQVASKPSPKKVAKVQAPPKATQSVKNNSTTKAPPKKKAPVAKKTAPQKLPSIKPMEKTVPSPSQELYIPDAVSTLNVEKEKEIGGIEQYCYLLKEILDPLFELETSAFLDLEITLSSEGEFIRAKVNSFSDLLTKELVIHKLSEIKYPKFFKELSREKEFTFPLEIRPCDES